MNNNEEINILKRDLELMRERYLKLVDAHGQLQAQNSILEERVLSIVETYSNENKQLEQTLNDAKQQIFILQQMTNELQIEKQRYKDDCNLAVRLLHRHPNDFISMTSGQIQEQIKNRFDSTTINPSIVCQRTVLMPTFPPTFVVPPPLISSATIMSSSINTPNTISTTDESLRLAAETLFKSSTVNRSPSSQFICTNCQRTVKHCDVSVQTSLDNIVQNNLSPRLRLVSLTASDDGLNSDDPWFSFDSTTNNQKGQINYTRQVFKDDKCNELPMCNVPRMHHV